MEKQGRSFAFVRFIRKEEAESTIKQLNGFIYKGEPLLLNLSRFTEERNKNTEIGSMPMKLDRRGNEYISGEANEDAQVKWNRCVW